MDIFNKLTDHATPWVKQMMAELPTDDRHHAWHALRAGLHALRDRLTVEEVAHLSAQLPLLIRGLFYEGWDPTGKPLRIRHANDFLALVREKYAPRSDTPATDIIRALFRILDRHVSRGELTDIMVNLPTELADLVRQGHVREDHPEG